MKPEDFLSHHSDLDSQRYDVWNECPCGVFIQHWNSNILSSNYCMYMCHTTDIWKSVLFVN